MLDASYPKISLVVCCHNRQDYIAEMLESVLDQEYPNTELVVIDDGSTDQSWEIIERYKTRLAYCEHIDTKTTSAQAALEYGFGKATGDILAQQSDKGVQLHKSLFTVARIFTDYPEVEWLTAIGAIINEHGSIINIMPTRKDLHEHLIHVPWNIQTESTFWRRSLWERAGGHWDFGLGWAADYGLWCHFFVAGATLYHLNTVLGAYRKTMTASGVKNPKQYYDSAAKYRAWLRTHVAKKELGYAALYRALRYLKPLLRNIPDGVYCKLPLLNHFSQEAIRFKKMNELETYRRNPFRTVYPW